MGKPVLNTSKSICYYLSQISQYMLGYVNIYDIDLVGFIGNNTANIITKVVRIVKWYTKPLYLEVHDPSEWIRKLKRIYTKSM